MEPKIEVITEKKLIGMRMKMSLSQNKTAQLWQSFMPRRNEVENRVNIDFYSMQVYENDFDFNPNTEFEKWAVVEVTNFNNIPDGMETYILHGGKYAVFIHKGAANTFHKTMQNIFGAWLPDSEYELDRREHFEILKEDYNPQDPNAEEEVWIPIKEKRMQKKSDFLVKK